MAVEQVVLLVDRAHSEEIMHLPTSAALWLVDSPANRPFISSIKSKFTPEVQGELTWFSDVPELSPEDLAAHVVDTIEDHHGQYSQQPPFARLTVIGAVSDTHLLKALAEVGFRPAPSASDRVEFEQ